jgi:hypothetical protein
MAQIPQKCRDGHPSCLSHFCGPCPKGQVGQAGGLFCILAQFLCMKHEADREKKLFFMQLDPKDGLYLLAGFLIRFYAIVWLILRSHVLLNLPRLPFQLLGALFLTLAVYLLHNLFLNKIDEEDYLKWLVYPVGFFVFALLGALSDEVSLGSLIDFFWLQNT